MVQIGGVVMALGLVWAGVQGLRGVPDTTGKTTSKGMAVVCLVLAVLLATGAIAAPYLLWER
jgi:hypothetical protein